MYIWIIFLLIVLYYNKTNIALLLTRGLGYLVIFKNKLTKDDTSQQIIYIKHNDSLIGDIAQLEAPPSDPTNTIEIELQQNK